MEYARVWPSGMTSLFSISRSCDDDEFIRETWIFVGRLGGGQQGKGFLGMEDTHETGGDHHGDSVADASSMAYAAAEAAAAAAAAEAEEDLATRTCRICSKGGEDGRAMLHFPSAELDLSVAQVAPQVTTFTEDIVMHLFCGKTASILPNVNMPQYEILSKAGLKNKHGIGSEVNTALARTRYATTAAPGSKDKQFYIVQEFEANLAAVRIAAGTHAYHQQSQAPEIAIPPHPHQIYAHASVPDSHYTTTSPSEASPVQQPQLKAAPVRAAAGTSVTKPNQRKEEAWAYIPQQQDVQLTSDGKMKCACGGSHLPPGTPKGDTSFRSHMMTKRHQKWMEDNGLLGAV